MCHSKGYYITKTLFPPLHKTSANYDIMYPAWTFWAGGPAISTEPKGLGRWDLKRKTIAESSDNWLWEDKRTIAFFRGSRYFLEVISYPLQLESICSIMVGIVQAKQ
jgi:hypothetical protein